MSAPTNPGKTVTHENALYRSRIEIYRILQALARDNISVSVEIGDGRLFVSRILCVEPKADRLVIAYCANKSLNSALFELPSLEFTATNRQDAHLVFKVSDPVETQFDDKPAIQFALPKSLVLYHRRENPRIPVPAETSLRCIADAGGFAPFESHIADISHDGLGGILYDRDIKLGPGAILKGCRIIIPGGKAIVADLELRYVTLITLPDGTLANRAGFRFIQKPDELVELLNFFIQDLDRNQAMPQL